MHPIALETLTFLERDLEEAAKAVASLAITTGGLQEWSLKSVFDLEHTEHLPVHNLKEALRHLFEAQTDLKQFLATARTPAPAEPEQQQEQTQQNTTV